MPSDRATIVVNLLRRDRLLIESGPRCWVQCRIEIETFRRGDQALRFRVDGIEFVREEERFEQLERARRLSTGRSKAAIRTVRILAVLLRFCIDEGAREVEALSHELQQSAEFRRTLLQLYVGALCAVRELTLKGGCDRADLLYGRLVPRFVQRAEPACGDLDAVVNVQGEDARGKSRSRARSEQGSDDRSRVLQIASDTRVSAACAVK